MISTLFNKRFIVAALGLSLLTACQQDVDGRLPDPPENSIPGDSLLERWELLWTGDSGDDSTTHLLSYDNQNRLSRIELVNHYPGGTTLVEYFHEIIRNSSGQIIRIESSYPVQPPPHDHYVRKFHYENGRCRYSTNGEGGPTTDSTIYNYNAAGTLIQSKDYYANGVGGAFSLSTTTDYELDANNNILKETTSFAPGADVMVDISTYDTKQNPLQAAPADFVPLMGLFNDYGKNNLIKTTSEYIGPSGVEYSQESTETYLYGNDGLPKSSPGTSHATWVGTPYENATFKRRYIYRKKS